MVTLRTIFYKPANALLVNCFAKMSYQTVADLGGKGVVPLWSCENESSFWIFQQVLAHLLKLELDLFLHVVSPECEDFFPLCRQKKGH